MGSHVSWLDCCGSASVALEHPPNPTMVDRQHLHQVGNRRMAREEGGQMVQPWGAVLSFPCQPHPAQPSGSDSCSLCKPLAPLKWAIFTHLSLRNLWIAEATIPFWGLGNIWWSSLTCLSSTATKKHTEDGHYPHFMGQRLRSWPL